MITWLKAAVGGMSTLQSILWIGGLAALLSGSGGFYAGVRWQKGSEFDAIEQALAVERENGARALQILQTSWEDKWAEAQAQVFAWQDQAARDRQRAKNLETDTANLLNKYLELKDATETIRDFGMCKFTDDSIRLLDSAQQARRNTEATFRSED